MPAAPDGEVDEAVEPVLWEPGIAIDASWPPPPPSGGTPGTMIVLPPPIVTMVVVPPALTTVGPTPGVAVVERCHLPGSDAVPTVSLLQSSGDAAADRALLRRPMRRSSNEAPEAEPRCALASTIVLSPLEPGVAPARAGGVHLVAPSSLEASRLAGDQQIRPSDIVKVEIQRAGQHRLMIPVKFCVDPDGRVDGVTVLRSSGYLAYDLDFINGVAAWRYRPFLINGSPERVCSLAQFIYNQR